MIKEKRESCDEEIWLEEARSEIKKNPRGGTYIVTNVGKFGPSEPVANDRTLWSASRVSVNDAVRGGDPFQGVPRYDGRACDGIYATVQK
jgi:hypothetical protein